MKKKIRPLLAWAAVVICSAAIFLIVPIARAVQNFVSEKWGRALFGYSVLICTGVAFLFGLYLIIVKLKIRSPLNYAVLILTAAAYVYFTLLLWDSPEESVHFLEYGVLGYLLFNALKYRIKDKSVYFSAFLIGSLIGTFDEILQWAVPERFWDFRDVGLNALATGLFLFALALGIRPKIISGRIQQSSFRTASVLLASNVVLLGLCFSNTPDRVRAYTEKFAFLAPLQKEEAMNQFNLKHEDSEIGIFYSRLTVDQLLKTDRVSAGENGRILSEWKDRDYAQFLRHFTGIWAPFLHEMRVHIYRRDKRYERAIHAENEDVKKRDLLIAFKENQILEKYFGNTLRESPYLWEEAARMFAANTIDEDVPYRSPVSATPFTPRSEGQLWICILLLLILLLTANKVFAKRFS